MSDAVASARTINALRDDERRTTRAAIEEALEPYRRADGSYRVPGAARGVYGR